MQRNRGKRVGKAEVKTDERQHVVGWVEGVMFVEGKTDKDAHWFESAEDQRV